MQLVVTNSCKCIQISDFPLATTCFETYSTCKHTRNNLSLNASNHFGYVSNSMHRDKTEVSQLIASKRMK